MVRPLQSGNKVVPHNRDENMDFAYLHITAHEGLAGPHESYRGKEMSFDLIQSHLRKHDSFLYQNDSTSLDLSLAPGPGEVMLWMTDPSSTTT